MRCACVDSVPERREKEGTEEEGRKAKRKDETKRGRHEIEQEDYMIERGR